MLIEPRLSVKLIILTVYTYRYCSMLSTTDLLHQRLDLLEITYIGTAARDNLTASRSVIDRVEALGARFSSIQDQTPAFRTCYDTVMRLKPLIREKDATITALSQHLDGLTATKETLQANVRTLVEISELSAALRDDDLKGELTWVSNHIVRWVPNLNNTVVFFTEIDTLTQRLQQLTTTLLSLKREIKAQTEAVDELLGLFEQAVRR
jgi:regulator of replication initiation timing